MRAGNRGLWSRRLWIDEGSVAVAGRRTPGFQPFPFPEARGSSVTVVAAARHGVCRDPLRTVSAQISQGLCTFSLENIPGKYRLR